MTPPPPRIVRYAAPLITGIRDADTPLSELRVTLVNRSANEAELFAPGAVPGAALSLVTGVDQALTATAHLLAFPALTLIPDAHGEWTATVLLTGGSAAPVSVGVASISVLRPDELFTPAGDTELILLSLIHI